MYKLDFLQWPVKLKLSFNNHAFLSKSFALFKNNSVLILKAVEILFNN